MAQRKRSDPNPNEERCYTAISRNTSKTHPFQAVGEGSPVGEAARLNHLGHAAQDLKSGNLGTKKKTKTKDGGGGG